MKAFLPALICAFAFAASGARTATPDFSGTWVFNASKSENAGMMASAQIISTIQQTAKTLTVVDDSQVMGQTQSHQTTYDLSGKPAKNDSPMGESSRTTSKWTGNKLVTMWESEGAVAGTTTTRIETRYLSDDGKTMFLESTRGKNPPMVIVFDRK